MTFGEALRGRRRERGVTQKRLAELLGVTERTVQNYETGRILPKRAEVYSLAAEALELPPGAFQAACPPKTGEV